MAHPNVFVLYTTAPQTWRWPGYSKLFGLYLSHVYLKKASLNRFVVALARKDKEARSSAGEWRVAAFVA